MQTPKWKKVLILVIGLLENLIFTGSILGWSALNYMLKEEGIFSEYCQHESSHNLSTWSESPFASINKSVVEYIMKPSEEEKIANLNSSRVTYTFEDSFDPWNSSVLYADQNSETPTPTPTPFIPVFSSSPAAIASTQSPSPQVTVCHVQERLLNLAYTLGTFFNGFTAFIWGFLLEKWGLRKVRLLINSFLTSGSLLLCFTTRERSFLVFPSVILLCLGGVPLRIADMQIANLFPKHRSSVITLYSGAFSASAITFVLLKFFWDSGLPFSWTCGILVGVSLAMLPITFFLLPSHAIREDDLSESQVELTFSNGRLFRRRNVKVASTVSLANFKYLSSPKNCRKIFAIDPVTNPSGKDFQAKPQVNSISKISQSSVTLSTITATEELQIPLRESLLSLPFMLHQWWFSWLITYMIMYVGAMNLWLNRVTNEKSVVGYFYQLYGGTQVTSLLLAPLAGLWLDYQVNLASQEPDPLKRRLKRYKSGFWPLLFTTSSLAGILVCRFFDNNTAVHFSIFFITFLRAFLVAVGSAFLRIRFPAEHFSKLLGIMSTVGAIVSLSQFPLFVWEAAFPSHAIWVNLFCCACTLFAYLNPLHLCFTKLQKRLIAREDQFLIQK